MRITGIIAAASLLATVTAHATEIDFSKMVLDQDGRPFTDCLEWNKEAPPQCAKLVDMTLGRLAFMSLNVPEQGAAPADVVKRGNLALKLYTAKRIDVTADEVETIKSALGKRALTPIALIRANEMLDRGAGVAK